MRYDETDEDGGGVGEDNGSGGTAEMSRHTKGSHSR